MDGVVDSAAAATTTHICVETQPRRHSYWQIGDKTHEERGECGDGRRGGDEVALDLCDARIVRIVTLAQIGGRWWADACPSCVGNDGCVDGNLEQKSGREQNYRE